MLYPGGDAVDTLTTIFVVLTFVLPAVFILADDRMWTRKDR
jgi:hypothetical protein